MGLWCSLRFLCHSAVLTEHNSKIMIFPISTTLAGETAQRLLQFMSCFWSGTENPGLAPQFVRKWTMIVFIVDAMVHNLCCSKFNQKQLQWLCWFWMQVFLAWLVGHLGFGSLDAHMWMSSKFKAGLDATLSPVKALKENPAWSACWLPIALLMVFAFVACRSGTGSLATDLLTTWTEVSLSPVTYKKYSIARRPSIPWAWKGLLGWVWPTVIAASYD